MRAAASTDSAATAPPRVRAATKGSPPARSATAKAGLPDDVVLVSRGELDGLQDRLYQLRCALEDVQTLLTERPTKAELERSLSDLLRSTGRLDRLWVSERAG